MGQINMPMLNKVGYSMFWDSMWDNKINYTRSFKEDIYLKRFIILIFDDCISSNTIKFYNKKYSKLILNTYRIPTRLKSNKELYSYLIKNNKVVFYNSKVWVLKYQKWVVLYLYIYLPLHNKLKKKVIFKNYIPSHNDNIFSLYNFYKKSNLKIQSSFSYFNNQYKKSCF